MFGRATVRGADFDDFSDIDDSDESESDEDEVAASGNALRPLGWYSTNSMRVLEDIIIANQLTEASSSFDYDDGDGIFEPRELGYQEWKNGELLVLSFGPSPTSSYLYDLRVLPRSIGDLRSLEYLDVHGNSLRELPEQLTALSRLVVLLAFDNQISFVPDGLGDLARLEKLHFGQNRITELPLSIGSLESLEWLGLSNNPLRELPYTLTRLLSLGFLDVSQHATAVHPGPPYEGLLSLPAGLGSMPRLVELHVRGTRFGCRGSGPGYLWDGSIERVLGSPADACSASRVSGA